MGFFKNLFEKKNCDICGGEIGLLGNRKLEDGNCCKECAKKLSPWFAERRHSTVAEIRQQLADREANRERVAAFHRTRTYGKTMMVYMDEDAGKFMVTDARDLEKANPDVLDFSQVTACDLDIREAKNEVYRQVRDEEGKLQNESYSPRRYRYSYDFRMKIGVNHPYIEEMDFSLSGGYIQVRARDRNTVTSLLFGNQGAEYGPDGSSSCPPTQADCRENDDYVRCQRWAGEIRDILMTQRPKASPVNSLLETYKAQEARYREAKASGDPGRVYEAEHTRKDLQKKLCDAYLSELGQTPAQDCSALLAAFTLADRESREARANQDQDRCLLADNAKEVLMERLMEARSRDPEGFERAGVMEALGGSSGQAAPRKTVTCPWCGSQVDAGKFCGNCGGKLD